MQLFSVKDSLANQNICSQVKSIWAVLSFRVSTCVDIQWSIKPHRTTVLHEYRHTTMKYNSINLYSTNLLTDFDYTYAIYKKWLPIHKLKNTNMYKCFANTVHVQRETLWVKQLAGEECKIVLVHEYVNIHILLSLLSVCGVMYSQ